jgi:hypothetical protein
MKKGGQAFNAFDGVIAKSEIRSVLYAAAMIR